MYPCSSVPVFILQKEVTESIHSVALQQLKLKTWLCVWAPKIRVETQCPQ